MTKPARTPPALSTVRGFQATPVDDDVVSANCSPVLGASGVPSPGVSGITKLRMQMEPLSLDGPSRSSSVARSAVVSRSQSRDGVRSDGGSECSDNASTSYEVSLEHDFASESVGGHPGLMEPVEGGLKPRRKMTSAEFEPLRCLGKGSYGTVLLVKQRATGRLYAQKQFKKASPRGAQAH